MRLTRYYVFFFSLLLVAAGALGLVDPLSGQRLPDLKFAGAPEELVLAAEDLPVSLSMSQTDSQDSGCSVVFFEEQAPTHGQLWGVVVNLHVADSVEEARAHFAASQDVHRVGSSLPVAGPQEVVGSIQLTAQLPEADEALLFRLESRLNDIHVIEYRYRLRVGLAVVDLAVTHRAGAEGLEPPAVRDTVREIAVRQAVRLTDASS